LRFESVSEGIWVGDCEGVLDALGGVYGGWAVLGFVLAEGYV
jgi:hypothetical protein